MRRLCSLAVPVLLLLIPVARAQVGPPSPNMVAWSQFRTHLSPAEVIEHLDEFYQTEISKPIAVAAPEIVPGRRYCLWRDMWIDVAPIAFGAQVTLQRQTDPMHNRFVKGWMLELAIKLEIVGDATFADHAPLEREEETVFTGKDDLAAALAGAPGAWVEVPSWRHQALFLSTQGLGSVSLNDPADAPGRESSSVWLAAGAGQQARASASGPGSPAAGSTAAPPSRLVILAPGTDALRALAPRLLEALARPRVFEVRSAGQDAYEIRYRAPRSVARVALRLAEVSSDGSERKIAEVAGLRNPKNSGADLARMIVRNLQPGVYRVKMSDPAGLVDQRDLEFDGRIFRETTMRGAARNNSQPSPASPGPPSASKTAPLPPVQSASTHGRG